MPKDIDTELAEGKEAKKVVVVEEVPETNEKVEQVSEVSKVLQEKTKETTSDSETSSELTEKPNYLWIIIPTALLVGALVGGLITYFSGISKLSKSVSSPTPVVSTTPQSSPSASPSASIKRSEIKVQVLNGSGTSGLAGKAKSYLEGLGYKDVAVGNAATSDFTETEIQIKETKKDFIKTITDDLAKDYTVSKETKTLVSSSKYDIVITLGSK